MRRLALSGSETTVVLPSRNLERIALSIWSLSPNRVRCIPNGVNCAVFTAPSREIKSEHSPIVIGTVASLRREKNIARLIRAFAAIATTSRPGAVELVIVGDGAERSGLEKLASELNVADKISFVGQSDHPETWLQTMDIFALSSDTEQMPISLLEAMAAALPVVATAVGDVSKIVSEPNGGFIVAPRDDAFQDALARLVDNRLAQLAIGRSNEKKARERYDECVMAARYAEVIDQSGAVLS
jgi:glycosyltransferase involved in cell wall biosynthesis